LTPNSGIAYNNHGYLKLNAGDPDEALRLLRQCIATTVTDFTEHASAKAEVESMLIGAHFELVGEEARRAVVLDTGVGLSVRNVLRGDPADLAGLKDKDILAAINGRPATLQAVQHLCESGKPNEAVKLTILRSSRRRELILTLASRK